MKSWLKKLFLAVTAVLAFTIGGLEIATHLCDCSNQLSAEELQIPVCENNKTYQKDLQLLLDSLQAKRNQGQSVSRAEYREATDKLVFEVDQSQIGIVNGIACNGKIAYVAEELPPQAKLFVKRHELEHLFQIPYAENNELKANIAAAKEYPVGLLSTIGFSVLKLKRYFSWCCFFVIGWLNFKVYFLGIGPY